MARRLFWAVALASSSAWASTAGSQDDVQALRAELAELRALANARFHPEGSRNADTPSARRLAALQLPTSGSTYFTKTAPGATAATATYVLSKIPEAQRVHESGFEDAQTALTTIWLLICGIFVMFMHPGFALLEAGSCRAKNATNVLFKNLINVTVGTVAWYFFGWAFAYGGPKDSEGFLKNRFIGGEGFASSGFISSDDDHGTMVPTQTMTSWFFQWAFCTAAATIVSGGIAERVRFAPYAVYIFIMTAWIYPVVVAWTWNYGWLSRVGDDAGYMDFAGSGIVHLTGGVSALAGAAILGPRKGRFDEDAEEKFAPHNLPLLVMGTFCLWFGWYGFNCGSTLAMQTSENGALAAQVAMNTTMSASVAGLVVFSLKFITLKLYDVPAFCNGILGGLVSITAGCGNVETGSAICIGLIGGLVYTGSAMVVKKMQVDDPVDAGCVHGACGIWGVLAAALFDWGKGFHHFHGWNGFSCMTGDDGTCRKGGIGWTVLGVNIAMVLCILLWAGVFSGAIFFLLKKFAFLRIDDATEDMGMDEKAHSPGKAYEMEGEERHYGGQSVDMETI